VFALVYLIGISCNAQYADFVVISVSRRWV